MSIRRCAFFLVEVLTSSVCARAAQLGAARAIINFTCLKLEIFAVGWSMKNNIRGEKS